SIEIALQEFAAGYPEAAATRAPKGASLLLAIGSERGFCGDFNEAVADAVRERWARASGERERAIVVGTRLAARLGGDPRIIAAFRGPSVAEEVPRVIKQTMSAVQELLASRDGLASGALLIVSHRAEGEAPAPRRVFPPAPQTAGIQRAQAPRTYLGVHELFAALLAHFLWAVLHASFYGSLMAENRRRLQHMEGAIRRLEERTDGLQRKVQMLRQEEITEEIEIIMLSRDALRSTPRTEARRA
ncbi:MAG: F0F1 ATP synthase subunit gamma, partial [Bradyrhizobium sp.]